MNETNEKLNLNWIGIILCFKLNNICVINNSPIRGVVILIPFIDKIQSKSKQAF